MLLIPYTSSHLHIKTIIIKAIITELSSNRHSVCHTGPYTDCVNLEGSYGRNERGGQMQEGWVQVRTARNPLTSTFIQQSMIPPIHGMEINMYTRFNLREATMHRTNLLTNTLVDDYTDNNTVDSCVHDDGCQSAITEVHIDADAFFVWCHGSRWTPGGYSQCPLRMWSGDNSNGVHPHWPCWSAKRKEKAIIVGKLDVVNQRKP